MIYQQASKRLQLLGQEKERGGRVTKAKLELVQTALSQDNIFDLMKTNQRSPVPSKH